MKTKQIKLTDVEILKLLNGDAVTVTGSIKGNRGKLTLSFDF